jgi:hypothetical protein
MAAGLDSIGTMTNRSTLNTASSGDIFIKIAGVRANAALS